MATQVAEVRSESRIQEGPGRSQLITWQHALLEDPKLFEGCTSIFLDVGSSRGTHVRKLFEPQKYTGAKYLHVFDNGFGPAERRARPSSESGICAFGFEANPKLTSRLQTIEAAYRAKGWRAKWFAPAAVSNATGNVKFWINHNESHSDWSASMMKFGHDPTPVSVPALDLSKFMDELNQHASPGYRLRKMDIEAAEFAVLPHFLTKQLLCKNVLTDLTIEWHDRFLKNDASRKKAKQLESLVMSPQKCDSGPSTNVRAFDDESFVNDGMPLP